MRAARLAPLLLLPLARAQVYVTASVTFAAFGPPASFSAAWSGPPRDLLSALPCVAALLAQQVSGALTPLDWRPRPPSSGRDLWASALLLRHDGAARLAPFALRSDALLPAVATFLGDPGRGDCAALGLFTVPAPSFAPTLPDWWGMLALPPPIKAPPRPPPLWRPPTPRAPTLPPPASPAPPPAPPPAPIPAPLFDTAVARLAGPPSLAPPPAPISLVPLSQTIPWLASAGVPMAGAAVALLLLGLAGHAVPRLLLLRRWQRWAKDAPQAADAPVLV